MPKSKLFFFGTPAIAVPALQALAATPNIKIVGVGTPPDAPIGRKHVLTPCPTKTAAQTLSLPTFDIHTKADITQVLQDHPCDLGLVIAFGKLFPTQALTIPPNGVVNVHFSLLPQYRGASPVQAAILNGDTTSGITFQRMVTQLDAGDILLQQEHPIQGKTTTQLWEEMAQLTAQLLPGFITQYTSGTITPTPQDETQATHCGKFTREDGQINPQAETAQQIYQKYLAFQPFPEIFLPIPSGNLKLKEISPTPTTNATELPCTQGSIWILKAQLPGGTPLPISEILKGHPRILEA